MRASPGPPAFSRPAVSPPLVDGHEAERIAVLRGMPSDVLAAELQQRGWLVMEPRAPRPASVNEAKLRAFDIAPT